MSIFDFSLLWAICWDSEKALYIMVSDKRWAHKIYSKTTSHCFNLKEKQKTFRYFLPTANSCFKTTGQYYPILNVWGGFLKKSKSKTLSFAPCDSSNAALDGEKFKKNSPRNTGCFFTGPPLKVQSTKRLGLSRMIYVNEDSPYLGFPYFNFLGGY